MLFALPLLLLCILSAAQADALTYQAEYGELTGGASLGSMADISYVEGLKNDGDGVDITVSVPQDGFYDLTVNMASMDGGAIRKTMFCLTARIWVRLAWREQPSPLPYLRVCTWLKETM